MTTRNDDERMAMIAARQWGKSATQDALLQAMAHFGVDGRLRWPTKPLLCADDWRAWKDECKREDKRIALFTEAAANCGMTYSTR